jgi:hypothetical protein
MLNYTSVGLTLVPKLVVFDVGQRLNVLVLHVSKPAPGERVNIAHCDSMFSAKQGKCARRGKGARQGKGAKQSECARQGVA